MTPRPVSPISDVVALSKGGQPERVIDRIESSKTTYALRGSDFAKLADAGVPIVERRALARALFRAVPAFFHPRPEKRPDNRDGWLTCKLTGRRGTNCL